MAKTDWSHWDDFKYRRRLETFGNDDGPVIAAGPNGEFDAIWFVLPYDKTHHLLTSSIADQEN
jgi:hypothetical protein